MQKEVSVTELRKIKLMIGTPAYGGQMCVPYVISQIDLVNKCRDCGIVLKHCFIENESLITRARNNIAHLFLKSDFTHLLFIDADIGFTTNDVFSLMAYSDGRDIVCGSYPKKGIEWKTVKKAVEYGVSPNDLCNFIGNDVLNYKLDADGKFELQFGEPIEVLDTGTGFMLIDKKVFIELEKAHPEWKYRPDYSLGNPDMDKQLGSGITAFFDTAICVDETHPDRTKGGVKRYLSEDYKFCKDAREIGFKIHVLPWINLVHHGTYKYRGNIYPVIQMNEDLRKKDIEKKETLIKNVINPYNK